MNYFYIKVCKHILLYFFEILIVSFLISCLFEKMAPSITLYDNVEKIFLSYGIYQVIVFLTLSAIDDIHKDSNMMLISLLKLCILYKETNSINLKNVINEKIMIQLSTPAMNDNYIQILLTSIKSNIDIIDVSNFRLELIEREHDLNYYQLQWRLSFLLRLFK